MQQLCATRIGYIAPLWTCRLMCRGRSAESQGKQQRQSRERGRQTDRLGFVQVESASSQNDRAARQAY